MDSQGNILTPEQVRELRAFEAANQKRQAPLVEIPDAELPRVKAMTVEQRKAWFREMRRGMTKAERKQRRREARGA